MDPLRLVYCQEEEEEEEEEEKEEEELSKHHCLVLLPLPLLSFCRRAPPAVLL